MLSFLPQKNKKEIILEYILRVLVFFFFFMFLSIIVLIILLLPSFFFVKYKNETVSHQLESVRATHVREDGDPIALIKHTNALSKVLVTDSITTSQKEITDHIVFLGGENVKILGFSFTDEKDIIRLVITGVADTRGDLALFESDLQKDELFETASLPVSYLVRGTDNEFTITLTYKK
jgi:hypothetical protein